MLLIGAFSFILEPEYPELADSIPLSSENIFSVLRDDGQYDVYIDGVYWGIAYDSRNIVSDMPIYKSIDEVTQLEPS